MEFIRERITGSWLIALVTLLDAGKHPIKTKFAKWRTFY